MEKWLSKKSEDCEFNYNSVQNLTSHTTGFQHSIPEAQALYRQPMKMGEWLMSQRWITSDQLAVALKEQKRNPKRLGELLVDLGFISSGQLLVALSSLSGLPYVSLSNQILEATIVHQLTFDMVKRYNIILFHQDEHGVHLAMADPEDLLALDKIRLVLGANLSLIPYHATLRDIAHMIEIYYPQPKIDAHEGEVVRLIHDIILEAVRLKASDIHISPTDQRIDIHYRCDGLLHTAHTLHKDRWSAISVRLKIMSSLDIAESRRPQNGRFSLILGGREIDFRVSCHPIVHGENIVLRILDKTQSLRPLRDLGFLAEDIDILKQLVQRPQGLILLSGPTGSGKTTTLYALLGHIDTQARNVMTLEEPIEYSIPSIQQTEIREGGPFRFAEGIKSILRQDPDVIFISEIRDAETAQMALRASMTGHLVLGTIHAQDTLTIPQRLEDLGLSTSLLRGNLIAGIAQRLVRRLCENCRYPKIVTSYERTRYLLDSRVTRVNQAGSCEECLYSGYKGREAVVEVTCFQNTFEEEPKLHNTPTLWERGIEKVAAGITTLDELDRVIGVCS